MTCEEAERAQEGDRVEDAGVNDDEEDRPDVAATCARAVDAAFDGPKPEGEEGCENGQQSSRQFTRGVPVATKLQDKVVA